jgi:hypothetical protein
MKNIFIFGILILIFSVSCCYSFNDTQNLLYLQAYFNHQNVEKVSNYQGQIVSYSATLRDPSYM